MDCLLDGLGMGRVPRENMDSGSPRGAPFPPSLSVYFFFVFVFCIESVFLSNSMRS